MKSAYLIAYGKKKIRSNFPNPEQELKGLSQSRFSSRKSRQSPCMNQTINVLTQYNSEKAEMKKASQQKNSWQINVFDLERTASRANKLASQTKQDLLRTLAKKIDTEERNKRKSQFRAHQEEWLHDQKNINTTKKYLNSYVRYHEKKSVLDRNKKQADDVRSLKRSFSSTQSLKRKQSQKKLQQKANRFRQQQRHRLERAKILSNSRVYERSNSIRNEKKNVYMKKANDDMEQIRRLESRQNDLSKIISKTESKRRQLSCILKESDQYDSNALYITLRQTTRQMARRPSIGDKSSMRSSSIRSSSDAKVGFKTARESRKSIKKDILADF